MSATKVLLVLGAGGNIGASVAKLFSQNGYRVAVVARRLQDGTTDENGILNVQGDLGSPESVESMFDKVTAQLGVPNVVVYNAASAKFLSPENPLELPLDNFNQDMAVNTRGALVAAQRALQGFQKLPDATPKSFIYTGNFLNENIMPALISLGMGKAASAHLIENAAHAYGSKGFRFYYADERKADGKPAYGEKDGPNHAQLYLDLAKAGEQQPWLQTFVGGQGYKAFK